MSQLQGSTGGRGSKLCGIVLPVPVLAPRRQLVIGGGIVVESWPDMSGVPYDRSSSLIMDYNKSYRNPH